MKMKAFKHYGTVAALAVIILIFSILRPASFCTVKNFLNISRQAAPLAMVALGATFVMTINEFDLSIGNIVSLGGVIAALLSIKQVPVALCFLIAALICLLVGCVNGIVVARFQILSFITTLGMGTVLDGVIYGLTGGTTVFNGIPKAFTIPGILKIAGIPFITLVAVVLYLAFYVFMGHTAPGRKLYAIGGSKEAAEVAGIPIFRYRVLAFSLCGAIAGLAGALLRGGKRARQHPPAAGGGYRGSQGPGRTLWPPSPSPPRQFPHAPSGLAGPKNNTPTGGQGLRNAHRDLLFQGNKTGNTGLNKWRYFRKFENLYFFKNLTLSPYF